MRPKDYWAVVKAYNKADNDRLIYIAELVRGHGLRIVNLFAKRRIEKVENFWPMPWDKKHKDFEVGQISDKDRQKQVAELLKKINNG